RGARPLLHRAAGVGLAARPRAQDRPPGRSPGRRLPLRAGALRAAARGGRVRRPSAPRPRARDARASGDARRARPRPGAADRTPPARQPALRDRLSPAAALGRRAPARPGRAAAVPARARAHAPGRGDPPPRARRCGRPGRRDRVRDAGGRPGMKQYGRLLSYLRPYVWPRCVVAVVCMLSHSGVETSVPFIAKYTFDQVFNQQHPEALPLVVVLVLGAAFLRGGLDFVGGYLTDWVGQRVVTD